MHVMSILDVLIVNRVRPDSVGLMSSSEKGDELVLELTGEVSDGLTGFGADGHHLSEVRLGSCMCLKKPDLSRRRRVGFG